MGQRQTNLRLGAFLFVICLWPGTEWAQAQEVAGPAPDETLIYVIREGRFLGSGVGHWIAVNDQTVARLRNKRHAIVRAKAGVITLNLANSGVVVFSAGLDDRPGETVYLAWRVGDTEMTELDEADAERLLRRSKLMDPIDAPLPNDEQIEALLNLSRLGFDLMRPAAQELSPDAEHAVITIFRRNEAEQFEFGIWGEDGYLGTLAADEGIDLLVSPGEHYFLAGNVGTSLLRAQVEAGKRYYAWLDYGVMLGRVRLTPVTTQESGDLENWLEDVDRVELNAEAWTDGIRAREAIVSEFVRSTAERAGRGEVDFNLLSEEHAY